MKARLAALGATFCVVSTASAADIEVRTPRPGNGNVFELRYEPQAVHPGDIFRVTLDLGEEAEGGHVEVAGRRFPVILEGGDYVAYAGLDLDVKPGPARIEFQLGGFRGGRDFVVQPKTFGSESLRVKPSYTDLDKATSERVARETKRMNELWATVTPRKLWNEPFLKPTQGALGSPFGLRRIFNGQPRSPHSGLDIKSPTGTPIRASNRGRVVLAEDLFFTGNTVILDHGLGLYTFYAHQSRIDVKVGDVVERGDTLGLVGATGRVTGPHLHWGVKIMGARVDPVSLPGLVL